MMKKLMLLGCISAVSLAGALIAAPIGSALELVNLPLKVKFTLGAGEGGGGAFVIETLGARRLECKAFAGSGEFTSERLGVAEFKFKECKDPILGTTCTGLSDTAGNVTVKGEFHTRHLLPASEGVNAIMLAGTVHLSCLGVLFTALGCIASMDLLTKSSTSIVNTLVETVLIDLLQEKGEPKPLSVATDNSLGMENCVLLLKQEVKEFESAGLLDSGVITKFEKEGKAVTELVDLSGTP